MITHLSISHFKSIASADVEFGDITIFVGNNGSGKSNIVDAIRFIKDASQNGLDRAFSDRHGVESARQWSPTRPFRLGLGLTLAEPRFWANYQVQIDSSKGDYNIYREEFELRNIEESFMEDPDTGETDEVISLVRTSVRRERTGQISRRTWALDVASEDRNKHFDLTDIALWSRVRADEKQEKVTHADELMIGPSPSWEYGGIRRRLASFHIYSIFPNTLRTPQEPSNETYLTSEGRNLTSVFRRMRKTRRGNEAISQITESMRLILPNLERISVLSVGGYLVPQFHMHEPTGRRHVFNVAQMSDGSLRILGFLTALYQEPRPAIIALEEPEQTVHPGVLTMLAESIKEISRKTQVIVTTHSPHLLDQFEPSCIRPVELTEGLTQVGEIGPVQLSVVKDRLFSMGELLVSEGLHSGE